MCNFRYAFDVEDVVLWVCKYFAEEQLCVWTNGALPLLKIIWVVNKRDLDTHFWKCVMQQVVCAAVQRR